MNLNLTSSSSRTQKNTTQKIKHKQHKKICKSSFGFSILSAWVALSGGGGRGFGTSISYKEYMTELYACQKKTYTLFNFAAD